MWWIRFLATGFYVGRIPFAPGTFGTLSAFPLVWLLNRLGPTGYLIGAVLLVIASIAIAHFYEKQTHSHDASEVVIDEIAGFVVSMSWLPERLWMAWLAAFLLFRFLDITKPLVIGKIDRELPGGWGVVLDDVLAGIVTNMILQIIYQRTNWLGAQWPLN